MKKIIIALVTAALLASCNLFRLDEPREDLGLQRRQYTGKELRTDGYYLAKSTRENRLGLIVLYRNGVCLCTYIIINDTTLRVNTITEFDSNTPQFAYDIFHFVPFTHKPDSTTSFIK